MGSRPPEDFPTDLEEFIGYRFRDRRLLERALTHGSARDPGEFSNERLEFLGDSILGFVISDFLYADESEVDEGRMTKVKAEVVSRRTLLEVAETLDIASDLRVGRMFRSPAVIPQRIRGNAVEALIGALWLDGGLQPAAKFIDRFFGPRLDEAILAPGNEDYKSRLGQWAQKRYGVPAEYELEEVVGLDHDLSFTVRVVVDGKRLAQATGSTKKKAEQRAARRALRRVGADEELDS